MDITNDSDIPIKTLNVAHSKIQITVHSCEIYKRGFERDDAVKLRATLSEHFEVRHLPDGNVVVFFSSPSVIPLKHK